MSLWLLYCSRSRTITVLQACVSNLCFSAQLSRQEENRSVCIAPFLLHALMTGHTDFRATFGRLRCAYSQCLVPICDCFGAQTGAMSSESFARLLEYTVPAAQVEYYVWPIFLLWKVCRGQIPRVQALFSIFISCVAACCHYCGSHAGVARHSKGVVVRYSECV